ncbi:acyltransferase [Streptosporangiaceae bacterium NEAU-GS5]|nr:acyltransferase [Streptosporangiaceae bacterium NEAU-GS5]
MTLAAAVAPVVPTSQSPRLRVLDLLRFCAALGVLMFHYVETRAWGTPHAFPALSTVSAFGLYGVRLFFMISGFVILMTVWDSSPAEFAASRIARLYPAYWASVLILGALSLVGLTTDHRPGLGEFLVNFTMFQHGLRVRDLEIVYWTLWMELVFYVLVGVLAAVGVTYRNCLVFLGAWTFLLLLAERSGSHLLKIVFMPVAAPYFIAGVAFYLIRRFGPSLFPWLFVAVGWIIAVSHELKEQSIMTRFGVALGSGAVVGLVSLMFAVMALVALGKLDGLDRWRWMTWLGALTYPLYLFHHHVGFLVIQWLHPVLDNRLTLMVAIAVALLVAYAVHRLVERPLGPRLRAALRRSLSTAPRDRAAPV